MRAFVAVVPPTPALAPLARALPALREEHPSWGWVTPERWHVTLAFLGDVSDKRLVRLQSGLAEVAESAPPMTLRILGGGVFPNERRPRIAWAGLSGDLAALTVLAGNVAAAARAAGIEVERRAYRPHLTLARLRRDAPAADRLVPDLERLSGLPFRASQVVLMSSRLGPRPAYELISGWSLGGPGPAGYQA